MIVACEPTCRGNEHERVNAGFLSALNVAYPDQPLRLYAEKQHHIAIERCLSYDRLSIKKLEQRMIRLPLFAARTGVNTYRRMFRVVFEELITEGVDKIYMLSFNPEAMLAIKALKREAGFAHLKFTFVQHSLIEDIVDEECRGRKINLPVSEIPRRSLIDKLKRVDVAELPSMFWRSVRASAMKVSKFKERFGTGNLKIRDILEHEHSPDYRYVFLAPHAQKNAAYYMNPDQFDLFTVTMPVSLKPATPLPKNKFAKFAVYGNSDQLMLHNLLRGLSLRKPNAQYEIRIIGQNHFGANGFFNTTFAGKWGQRLDRAVMESAARDIDFFLMLSDSNSYRLTCSGTLFEAISLMKPLLYFASDCVDQFNTPQTPIGIRCTSLTDKIDHIVDITERFEEYSDLVSDFHKGILRLRMKLDSEDTAGAVRASFEW